MCVEELISLKEDFIDEVRDPDDNYDVSEAEEIKSAYEKCLVDIRVVKKKTFVTISYPIFPLFSAFL